MNDVEKIVSQCKSWLGKNGKDGSHKEIIDIYNSFGPLPRGYKVKYSDYWCATFVSAVFIKCGLHNLITRECSCQKMIDGLKKMGIFIENENMFPKIGDIVFYDWNDNGVNDCTGWSDHVGIVVGVSGNTFTTIEGNLNNSVGKRLCTVNQRYLRGFARPKYNFSVSPSHKTNEELAKEVIRGNWGNGSDRRKRLTVAGYNYTEIQKIVNEMLKGK